jgi:RNA polymerase sigma factor (sigma-70 family)
MPSELIGHIRRLVALPEVARLKDGDLLESFVADRNQAAVEALVLRHGPMVWGVCRRILGDHHDAEDAFQATFLVLVRKASSILPRQMVANWLHGVAQQTALKVRATAAKRRARERPVAEMPESAMADQDLWRDLQPLLDQELSRLPEKYRVVLVLCDLQGNSRKEAARQLGVPEGTIAGRLARARGMLAKRLSQRGVPLSAGVLAAVLSKKAASAGVPSSVVDSTIKAAEGVMKAMLFTKLRAGLGVVLLILGFVATGATIYTSRSAAGQDDKKAAKQEKDKEAFTAWGKEINGLQAGLGFRPGEKRAYRTGETVWLVVRVRNVGKKEVKFSYFNEFFYENPPAMTDGEGKPVYLEGFGFGGKARLVEVSLAPGKEAELCELSLKLKPASERGKERPVWTLFGTGRFQLQHENVGGGIIATGEIKFDPVLNKLATGKLDLEVMGVYTPEELIRKADSLKPDEKVAVQFKVRLVQPSPEIRKGPGKDDGWVEGHGPNDLGLYPSDRFDWTQKQFAAILTARAKQQLKRLGINDAGKHFNGTVIRVTGRISSYLPFTDDPESERQYELVIDDLSQIENVVVKADPPAQKQEQIDTAWGKEVGGLQAGLGFRPGQKRAYYQGEEATVVLRVRNVGKEAVEFKHIWAFFGENPPTITDAEGKPVRQLGLKPLGLQQPRTTTVAPGKEVELYEWNIHLLPNGATSKNLLTIHGTGKFSLQCERVVGPTRGNPTHPNPTFDKLATGKLELEVKEAEKK